MCPSAETSSRPIIALSIRRRRPGVLLAALAYFILPFDLLPDVFAVVGFTDDMAVFAAALRMIQGHIGDRHYQAADKALAADEEPAPAK